MHRVGSDHLVAGKYRVVRPLAEGGMGLVYEAVAIDTGLPVALKLLSEEAARDPSLRLRFAREIRSNGLLRGRHVVRVVDSGELAGGEPFMAMELLAGRSLAAELRTSGLLSVADACAVMVQVACGVAEAHSRGVIHRDLKPANVFLAGEGEARVAKVIDFGVSKLEGAAADHGLDDALTQSLSWLGTPAYMSPEQIRSARSVGRATDVWSFALILFRALAGRLPFNGTASSIPAAICNDAPISLHRLRADVPSDVDAAIGAALEKDPRLRPTLADLGDVLILHADASPDARVAHDAYVELSRLSLAELAASR